MGNECDSVLQVLKLKYKLDSTIILKRIQGEIYVWDKEKYIVGFFVMNQVFSWENLKRVYILLERS